MTKKKSYPYSGTDVTVERSRSEIDTLLRKYNIRGSQWSTVWERNFIELRFPVEFVDHGLRKMVTVILRPPDFESEHRTWSPTKGNVTVRTPDLKAAMRCLYYYVKTKLEAVTYGLTSLEEEFLSQVAYSLKDGTETTVGKILTKVIVQEKMEQLALEQQRPANKEKQTLDAEQESVVIEGQV
jgi:hypothetical protein